LFQVAFGLGHPRLGLINFCFQLLPIVQHPLDLLPGEIGPILRIYPKNKQLPDCYFAVLDRGFADLCLTIWLRRHEKKIAEKPPSKVISTHTIVPVRQIWPFSRSEILHS
jgi:hypothetical protein